MKTTTLSTSVTLGETFSNQITERIHVQPLIVHGTCIKFNQSDPFKIGDRYGGIPLNLLTNLIGWMILLVLFIMIRKNLVRTLGLRLASNTLIRVDAVVT